MQKQIPPHGGTLVNRVAGNAEKTALLERAKSLPNLKITQRNAYDLEMIATGAYSPLQGFLGKPEVETVAEKMRLPDGTVWPIPITLATTADQASKFKEGATIALSFEGQTIALLELSEKFELDKQAICAKVYGTTDSAHPGVSAFCKSGDTFLAGKITQLEQLKGEFESHKLLPSQSRELFEKNAWRRIVGFQTRNPIHRAHEYLIKCALEIADGAFIHPLVGETKSDDIPASVRMQCYRALVENYFPKDKAIISVMPANMHYAGPREAVLHALVRKNYGCTHFIVGRDHAGVGNYYGSYDAHKIFDQFNESEIGITPLFFEHAFYCKSCEDMVSKKTCPHDATHHVTLSGTKVREMLSRGEKPPMEFTRPEVAQILISKVYSEIDSLSQKLETATFAEADVLGVQIAAHGTEGINRLITLSTSAKPQVRKASVHGLWALYTLEDSRVPKTLENALHDEAKEVRACAAWGIGHFASEGEFEQTLAHKLDRALEQARAREKDKDTLLVINAAIKKCKAGV